MQMRQMHKLRPFCIMLLSSAIVLLVPPSCPHRPASIVLPVLQVLAFRETEPALFKGLSRYFNSLGKSHFDRPDAADAVVADVHRFAHAEFSDLTVLAPDGNRIYVHQIVLASCSNRFAGVLEQGKLRAWFFLVLPFCLPCPCTFMLDAWVPCILANMTSVFTHCLQMRLR